MKRQFKNLEKAEPVMNITRRISKLDQNLLAVQKDILELKRQIEHIRSAAEKKPVDGLHIPL